jgi:hypothetical protein
MKKKHSSKAFISYLETIGSDLKVFEQAKKDRRLNQLEQQLIQCWNLLRSNQFKKIFEITDKNSTDPLYQGQIDLVRGISLHNSGEIEKSITYLQSSIELMKRNDLRRMTFIAYYNLFNAYQNLKFNTQLRKVYEEWAKIPAANFNEETVLQRAQFRMHLSENNLSEAEKIIHQLEQKIEQMSELNRLNFHIDILDFFVMKKDFQSCELILGKLKKFRTYHSGAHFKYLKKLIDYNLHKTPFYIYERDYKENITLFHELSVLKNLEEKNISVADLYWQKLKNNRPHLFGDKFQYNGPECLFSIVLHALQISSPHVNSENHSTDRKSKEMKVYEFLSQRHSIEKNELYELIWNERPESKIDLTKLQTIISRYNQKNHDYQIKYRKGCYYLVTKEQKAS